MKYLAINIPVELIKSLDILWKGMFTIFLGIGIIFLIILVLGYVQDSQN